MIGIILTSALLVMFIVLTMTESTRVQTCHALYLKRFDNKPVTKNDHLQAIAEELTLHTNVRHVATHGCIICQKFNQLFTLSEAVPHLRNVRANAF